MAKLVTKLNNRSFIENFDYVEPYEMDTLKLTETFDS